MIVIPYFKKTLLILLSLGFISTANAIDGEEKYFIQTCANVKTFEKITDFKPVENDLRETIDGIVKNDQHLIFMINGKQDNYLQEITEIFTKFVTLIQDEPELIEFKALYSGGLDGEKDHDSLVLAPLVKNHYGNAIANVYAPVRDKGYSIEFNQARVFYKIDNPIQLQEFWHTEPAAMEQFLRWKHGEVGKKGGIRNILIVSKKPMCQFCSAFLLHCLYTEANQKNGINFVVFSLSALDNIATADELYLNENKDKISPHFFNLRKLLLKVAGKVEGESSKKIMGRGSKRSKVENTVFDRIKADSKVKGTEGNNLIIYGF